MKKKFLTLMVLASFLQASSQKMILLEDFEGEFAKKSQARAKEFANLLNGGSGYFSYYNGMVCYQSISIATSVSTDLLSLDAIKKNGLDLSQVTMLTINIGSGKELVKKVSLPYLKAFPALQYIVLESGSDKGQTTAKSVLPANLPASIAVLYKVAIDQ